MGKIKERMSNADRKIFRESVAKAIKNFKFDPEKRLKLSATEIDELLFDYDKDGYKYFAYTGKGLCKIDLSEANFKNAIFQTSQQVDLSYTNVKIIFNELYYMGNPLSQRYIISNVDFSGVDLSNSFGAYNDQWELQFDFALCNLSNTGLKPKIHHFNFMESDLDGIDLNGVTFVCNSLRSDKSILFTNGDDRSYNISIRNCNLSNTGATIKVTDKVLKTDVQKGKLGHFHDTISVEVEDYIAKLYKAGRLKGCTIEGMNLKSALKKINKPASPTEGATKQAKLQTYIDKTVDTLTSQIKEFSTEKSHDDCTGVGSFYGCGNVPQVEDPKEKSTGAGSFYGCDNVFIIPTPRELTPEEKEKAARKAANVKKYGKRLKRSPEAEAFLAGFDEYLKGDWIDE